MFNFKLFQFKGKACFCVLLSLFSLNAFAKEPNHYERMHVQISNLTKASCALDDQYVIHGRLLSSPPQVLREGESKSFDMLETILGPEVVLSYWCGDSYIRFDVQQDLSFLVGHEPMVTTLETRGLRIKSTSVSSSVFWNSPGLINIQITPAG